MKRIVACSIFICVLLFTAGDLSAKTSDLAGKWYSASRDRLRSELAAYLNGASGARVEGRIVGLLAPHAGFAYSGSVAAYSYRTLKGSSFSTVVVVGFTHRYYSEGTVSVLAADEYTTPLGHMPIDKELSAAFLEKGLHFRYLPAAFRQENSIEMQIPFIQMVLPDASIAVLALCDQDKETSSILAEAIAELLKGRDDVVLVGSTDMCHYLDDASARIRDGNTIARIERFDPEAFYRYSAEKGHKLMCGYGAAYAVMKASKMLGADEVELLKYANSGDTSGNKDRVVGYLSAAFVDVGTKNTDPRPSKKEKGMFTDEQRKELLALARNTIEQYLASGKKLVPLPGDPDLQKEMGAFVTLRRGSALRGCIGHMAATGPLDETVRDMAIAAATQDPRFPPLSKEELDDVDIEISVLSPMEKIDDPDGIVMGKHGVMVRRGYRTGVYLPQVADETGWTKEQFLDSLCSGKAGIPSDSWKTGNCDIYVFTAEVFGEKD